MRHFIYTISDVKVRRTYGGSYYTIKAYENKGKNKPLVYIGSVRPCTSAHKGESSEAWGIILDNVKGIKRRIPASCTNLLRGYDSYSERETAGIILQGI